MSEENEPIGLVGGGEALLMLRGGGDVQINWPAVEAQAEFARIALEAVHSVPVMSAWCLALVQVRDSPSPKGE